ncbi:IclR family transcriptional regulator [Reyranella sp. CPCC 100927]|uniref:IclR family transcriptional regulator n=1 Tax=Reyranella sp. CPCC 100927 TaxID=2599616 RepID=UPI0011B52509|nr:IclR family transcriptional regulator [Reyranella sp. CPCC 100927]TWT13657.1 IclR family transcriptional regulator [Reyranella sp. CPCC 100927]
MSQPEVRARKSRAKAAKSPAVVDDLKSEPGGTQAIDRALAVLFSFTADQPIRRVPELTEALGLNKSTVYRLLQALGAANLVRREDDSGSYKLGPAVLDLANCFLSTVDLGGDARPFLQAFAMQSGESVTLAILDGLDSISISQVRGSKTPQLVSRLSSRIPVYCSSSGKALILDHTDEQVYDLLARSDMRALTENTITDPKLFVQQLNRDRRQGWTLNDEESDIGMRTVGAPIRDHSGAIIAAVSASAPTFRLSKADVPTFARTVKDLASEISTALGGGNTFQPTKT